MGRDPLALERAARLYRSAASVCEASCTWSGQLPPRSSTAGPNSSYSTKIFLGGVPWDISEQTLVQAFAEFGEVRVEWPGRDYTSPPRGYLYLVFQDERDVIDLLSKCGQDYTSRDSYYYKYPIGSGRVTFNNSRAYMKAVAAAFIEIKTPRFCKKVQVDPYLEDT